MEKGIDVLTDGPSQSGDSPAAAEVQAIVVLPDAASAAAASQRTLIRRIAADRGWLVSWQEDPYVALADVCLQARLQQTRRGWEMDQTDPQGLVIVLSESAAAVGEAGLFDAVKQYAPGVGITVIRDEAAQDIIVVERRGAASPTDSTPRARQSFAAAPALRLAEPDDEVGAAALQDDHGEDDLDEDAAEVENLRITQEEIEMLFEPIPRQGDAS